MILRWFPAFRDLEQRAGELRKRNDDLTAAVTGLTEQSSDLHNRYEEVIHQLEIERTKRIAAESVASERGGQITYLREELAKSQSSRDEAQSAQLNSLNLVNTALLKPLTPEPVPDMTQWKAVPKQKVQAMNMRQADDRKFADAMKTGKLGDYVKGLYGQPQRPAPTEEIA